MRAASRALDEPVDVAVVGGGFGGACAALRAAEAGASITLLEARAEFGGTCLYSGGGVHIWGAETWPEYRQHCPLADEDLARTLFESYEPFVGWLTSTGAPGAYGSSTLRGLTTTKYQIGKGIAPHHKSAWFRYVNRRITELGGTVRVGAVVTSLSRPGRGEANYELVVGEAGQRVRARAVVLACGGFQSNPVMMRELVGGDADTYVSRAVATDRGDGLRLAWSVGATRTRSMSTIYGHLMPAPCRIDWSHHLDPILLSAFYAQYAIVLNSAGRRFVDEGAGELNGETANAAIVQPSGGLWVIFDESVRRSFGRYELPRALLRPTNVRYARMLRYMRPTFRARTIDVVVDSLRYAEDRGALVLSAETVDELARQLSEHGVDGAQASATITAFNAAARDGTAGSLDVPKTKSVYPLTQPPLYAIKVAVGVSMTYGGVAIDTSSRALDGNGEAVDGLFAVPGTAGGVHHVHYAGALAACGVYGMIAGDEAAAFARRYTAV